MILGTEINEFVTNRQQSKIHYLSEENKQLQDYIADLENALKLNKQAMSLALEGMNKKPQVLQQIIQFVSDSSTMSICYNYQNTQLETVIKLLNEENQKLVKSLSEQQRFCQQLQTKLLLQEQIGEEQQNYHKDLIGDLEYKLIELKRNIHDKEYAIQELERMKPIQDREGQLVKIVEIVTPSEQNLKMHEELENVRTLLSKITSEAQSISETNNTLREVNYQLKREIYKMRIVLRSQVSYQNMKGNLTLILDFVYNEYLDKTNDNIDINKEIQNHRGKLEQLHQELFGTQGLGYGFSPEPQQLKYLSKNERMIYQEKLHKMEMMVKGFKELFEKEKNNYTNISKIYNELLKKYEQIVDTNELLIRSNQLKDEKYQNTLAELQFYKKQSQSLMEQLRNRKAFNPVILNQEQDIAIGIFSPRFTNTQKTQQSSIEKYTNPEEIEIKNSSRQIITPRNQPIQQQTKTMSMLRKPNLPELEIEEDSSSLEQAKYCQTARGDVQQFQKKNLQQQQGQILQYYDQTKEECVNFLMSMFNDFFKNFDIGNIKKQQLMKQIEQKSSKNQKKLLRRSYSNPFLYFSNVNQITFRAAPKESVIAITKNEIQLLLAELQSKKQKQIHEQHDNDNDLFSVDVSKIDVRNQRKMLNNEISFISNFDQE